MRPIPRPTLDEIRAAAGRLRGKIVRTPLVRLELDPARDAPGSEIPEIYLKLENLQPIGSFKVRGSGNAMALADPGALAAGVFTASAGNMAQGVAWNARRLGAPCSVVVPDHAPKTKLEAIRRLGAEVIQVPFDEWWQVLVEHRYPGLGGLFIHPVSDPAVIAGNGTAGLEILEDLPEVDTIIVPFGGGGLSCGIAAAAKALRPGIRVVAAEVETAAPLSASIEAGSAVTTAYTPSFVDGIGGKSVLQEMWPLARDLLDGARTVSLEEIAGAIRLLVERSRVVAEGAGAASVAAALQGDGRSGEPSKRVVCVISGGNIDNRKLAAVLGGEVPAAG